MVKQFDLEDRILLYAGDAGMRSLILEYSFTCLTVMYSFRVRDDRREKKSDVVPDLIQFIFALY